MAKNCKMCGTQNGDDIQFCAACGSALDGDQGQLKRGAQRPAGMAAKTMMFGVAPQVNATAQTIAQTAPAPAATPAPAAPAAKVAPRTMLGVPAATAQTLVQPQAPIAQPAPMVKLGPAPAKPAPASEAWRDKRTVLGMPAVTAETPSQPPAPAAAPAAPVPAPAPASAGPETRPLEPVERKPASPRMPTQRVLDPAQEPPPRQEEWDDDEPPRKKGGKGLLIVAISAGAVVVIGIAFLLVWLFLLKGGGGLAGQAPAQSCVVTADMSGLVAAEPSFLVTFTVADGLQLVVAGRPAQLVGGKLLYPVPLSQVAGAEESGDTLLVKIPFHVLDGDAVVQQGPYVVPVPLTRLQVDRPAQGASVAVESVPVAGITEEGAVVTVNGAAVSVTAGVFRSAVPLPAIGEQAIEIAARAPGKAQRKQVVKVTRVQSLDAAIAKWREDLGPEIDYPTLARDPALQIGKKVVYRGRVTNILTERGVTMFPLSLVTGCPKGTRCAVYVTLRGETDAGSLSMVDVFGKINGSSNVQFPGGKQEMMPSIDADFVVRVDEEATAKRGRR